MKKQFTGFMAMMLSLMVVMTSLPLMSVQAVETNGSEEAVAAEGEAVETVSGNCGENAFYTLDSEGVLTISGTGEIYLYDYECDEEGFGTVLDPSEIKEVIIEDGITSIGKNTFANCTSLKTISIPNGVTEIGLWAFGACTALESISIPDSVTYIESCAFSESAIETVYYEGTQEQWEEIYSGDFSGNVIIENPEEEDPDDEEETYTCTLDEKGVLTIEGTGSFLGVGMESRELVKSVVIKDGITGISSRAFMDCTNLETISIPDSVTQMGERVFSGCSSLKSIDLPDNILRLEFGTFYGCTGLTSVTLPKNLTAISGYVFDGCSNLASITIPDSVTVIMDGAFRNCSKLTSINIPKGVTSIADSAFNGSSINDIYYEGTREQWDKIYSGDFTGNVICKDSSSVPHTHTPSDWTVTKAATEDAVGTKVKKCTGCGEVLETAEIAKLPCSHKTSKWVVTTEATAKKAGLKEKKCSKCGKVLDSEKLPKFKVTLNATKVSLQQGKSTTAIKATVMKGDKVKSWKSSDAKVATVNSKGKITAKKAGTATITVTTKKGAKATVKVTVQNKAVKCTKLKVDKKKLTLKAKKSYQLNVTKTPVTTLEKVTYTSSNKKVATVNSKGKITARKAGTATITVKCGKKTVKVQVTVKKK